ncbi:hypothetical protein RG959_18185 [Domibacillus sp. 8LH]|uniref:hypothetical protein n=1 Tax=Domibacillus TaxID=1433999 RepID=UPI00203DE2CE|nr:hypothetical protein [Domibacillus indicus]MCM3787202.1 hypothetical protein [Domibacillus indicus]
MPAFFILMVVAVAIFLVVKAVKKKSLPDNYYTPYDDLQLSQSFDSHSYKRQQETKHEHPYEEKQRD